MKRIKAANLVNDNALSMATTLYEMCEDMDRQEEIVLFEGTPEEFFDNCDSRVLASTILD